MSAGPQTPYGNESGIQMEQEEGFGSSLKRVFSELLRSLKRLLLNLSIQSDGAENFKIYLPLTVSDNGLKEETPNKTFREREYIDVGKDQMGAYTEMSYSLS